MTTINTRAIMTVVAVLVACGVPRAGEWHVEPNLMCQNCHIQHASKEGEPLPGGPFSTLLLKNTVNELCLSCHDGSDPTAPDVLTPVQMYQSTASGESAGGYFNLIGVDNLMGHNLGLGSATPLQVEAAFVELSCASCHAPHGNGNYRNLLHDPAATGDSILVVDGTDLFTEFSPDIPPTVGGSIAAYSRDNVAYRQSYSLWCTACHDQLSVNLTSTAPAHFSSHPSDVALNEYISDSHADAAHWIDGTGEGFPNDASGVARVPFEAPPATNFIEASQPAETNEVFCGSCHKAHGGAKMKSLLWSYLEGEADYIAGCQQCHNK